MELVVKENLEEQVWNCMKQCAENKGYRIMSDGWWTFGIYKKIKVLKCFNKYKLLYIIHYNKRTLSIEAKDNESFNEIVALCQDLFDNIKDLNINIIKMFRTC